MVRASVLAWCLRFADRIEPEAVRLDVDGDAELARDLVGAADAFSGL